MPNSPSAIRLRLQYVLGGMLIGICCANATGAKGDRSPIAVAVSPNGRWCASANHTSGSISLVDLRNASLVTEHRCGFGPTDVAWADHRTLLVCLQHEDAVAVLTIADERISLHRRISVGDQPRAIAITSGNSKPRAFVAISGADEIAVLDLSKWGVERRLPVGQQPSSVSLSPNMRWLVTACSFGGEVLVHDTSSYDQISRRPLLDQTGNLGLLTVLPDSTACIVPHIVNRTFPVNAENIEKGWVIDNRLSRLPLPNGEEWDQMQIGLDKRGDAVGDAHATTVSSDGKWLVVTCGGTHELLIFRHPNIPWPPADPGDFIPDSLLSDDDRFRRLELGGRPTGVDFIDDQTAVVANYLQNALQVVDVVKANILYTIDLGGPACQSLARRGEAIFYDADRSLNSWFSCHTCHTNGHTSGLTFDTLNDRSYNTQKLTPSLRGVIHSSPWTWQGWQKDLHASVKNSRASTMQTRQPPTDQDADAIVAFLATLKPFESPQLVDGQLNRKAQRGKALFHGKAGCAKCHAPPHFTTAQAMDVGLGVDSTEIREHNPPSLRGLHARRRFLHDGRALSLPAVVTRHHCPQDIGGEALIAEELQDLIAFLKSI